VFSRMEERREVLGEALSNHTAESAPDDSHVMLAQARVVERHQDKSDFLSSTELISERESFFFKKSHRRRSRNAVDCSWTEGYQGDDPDCTSPQHGPVHCTDTESEDHVWVKDNCQLMCNPQCAPKVDCPFDNPADHPDCDPQFCKVSTMTTPEPEKVHWAQVHCPRMCNPECNPKTPHISFGSVTYIPGATLQPGHRNCAEKLTVETEAGDTKNFVVGELKRVAVCGKCAGQKFMLHPAYTVGNRVVGVCEKVTDHWLWKEQEGQCEEHNKPCAGEVISRCEKFGGRFGEYRGPTKNTYHEHHSIDSHSTGNVNKSLAFTCSRLYAHDFAASEPQNLGPSDFFGTKGASIAMDNAALPPISGSIKVYRIVQAKIASCYSTNEGEAARQEMECVNRKQVKSCHTRTVLMENIGLQAAVNAAQSSSILSEQAKLIEIAKSALMDKFNDDMRESTFRQLTEEGVTDQWTECDELDEKTAISLA